MTKRRMGDKADSVLKKQLRKKSGKQGRRLLDGRGVSYKQKGKLEQIKREMRKRGMNDAIEEEEFVADEEEIKENERQREVVRKEEQKRFGESQDYIDISQDVYGYTGDFRSIKGSAESRMMREPRDPNEEASTSRVGRVVRHHRSEGEEEVLNQQGCRYGVAGVCIQSKRGRECDSDLCSHERDMDFL